MQISSINAPHTSFSGIFSNLLGDRTNKRKPYKGKHFEKRHSSLECSSNYNKRLVQKRPIQKPRIDTGSILRLFETRVEPEVNYVIDSDTKIAVGEGRIFDLNSSSTRAYTNFLHEGDSIYIDSAFPVKRAPFCVQDKAGDKIALTKISNSLFILRVPSGLDKRVSLLENVEYIDPDERFSFMTKGIKYAVQTNSIIEIDGMKFTLNDFDLSNMEDKDTIPITKAMIKKDSDKSEIRYNAPMAYITKSKDVFFFSLAPETDLALYLGRKSLVKQEPSIYETQRNKNDVLSSSVATTTTSDLDEIIDVDVVIPDKLTAVPFETASDLAVVEEKKETIPLINPQGTMFDEEFINNAKTSSILDPETLVKYQRILNMLAVLLKGQELDPKSSCLTFKDEDGVEHFVFAGYKNGVISRINIVDLSSENENSGKLTSFNIESIDRLPENKAMLAKAFLQFLHNKIIAAPNGIILPSGDKS